MYESRPHTVIISLCNSLYKIPKVAPPTATSLIAAKKGSKLISQTRKFIFCLVHSQNKEKIIATSMTPAKGSSMQHHQQRDTVLTEHRSNFSSPIGVPTSFRWVTEFGYICRKNALQEPIRSSDHFDMVLTVVPRLWGTMLWSTTFLHSFACTKRSMWTVVDHASHHY